VRRIWDADGYKENRVVAQIAYAQAAIDFAVYFSWQFIERAWMRDQFPRCSVFPLLASDF
jgi:hypothetical protein